MQRPSPAPDLASACSPASYSAMLPPSFALASCVRAYVTRSTLGVALQTQERHNLYPASPACFISWTIQGQTELLRLGDQHVGSLAPSPVMFTGPHTLPCETRNPGPVQFFMLMFMPDAFQALTGLELMAFTNRHHALHEVLDSSWQAMAQAVLMAPNDAERVRLIESFLLPRWDAVRPRPWSRPTYYQDWVQGLAVRAAASGTGRSLRQVERRVKSWTGQTLRQLQRLGRAETTFLRARSAQTQGELRWADLAADQGFADQSHLCREFRKLTGLRPDEVFKAMDSDERLWIFRVWF